MNIIRAKAIITSITDRYTISAVLKDGAKVEVSISPSMKQYEGKELKEGDSIIIQMSPFDLSVGRLHRDTFLNFDDVYDA